MKVIAPPAVDNKRKQDVNKKKFTQKRYPLNNSPVFKGGAEITSLINETDSKVFNIFSQHYGNVGNRIGKKLASLVNSSNILKANSRFELDQGVCSITPKKMWKSILENIVFPVVQLPLYAASWVVKKFSKIPALENKADKIYRSNILRIPRKLKELDEKTDIIQGMYEKTSETIKDFAKRIKTDDILKACADDKEISAKIKHCISTNNTDLLNDLKKDVFVNILNNPEKNPQFKQSIQEANEFIKEKLYKASNKFFDKHTGNYNTAFERPLCRLASGIVPAIFLANDAYNLAILCGDTKDMSKKEARDRKQQEITRVLITAYMQLLIFGAFTKQVNTISWFVPVASAVTVLGSEIISRMKMKKPILFLSKEKAKEYNLKKNTKNKTAENGTVQNKGNNIKPALNPPAKQNTPGIFTSFKSSSEPTQQNNPKEKKDEPKKALMNIKTLSKLVAIALAGGFVLSFIKNSSYTKNSKLVKDINKLGKTLKNKFYDKIAYKEFEMSEKDFNGIIESLKEADCKEIAEGHEFIKNKYGKVTDGIIKMYKSSLPEANMKKAIDTILTSITQDKTYSEQEIKIINQAIQTAIKQNKTNLAENKFSEIAEKAIKIIKNKKIQLSEKETTNITNSILNELKNNIKSEAVKVETKTKPLADIVTEPFKFLLSFIKFPFKVTKGLIKIIVGPIEKKAAKELIGEAELTKYERTIHKVVTEIFGTTEEKAGKISQDIFANALEELSKKTAPFRQAQKSYQTALKNGQNIEKAKNVYEKAKNKLLIYVSSAVEKSFNGVTQSSNKNTDLAMMAKLASSAVTSAFLVADNYNMVMIKSDGEDKEGAKEKANERIIQRLSALFYQSMLINWFNSTFRSLYNSSLKGMTAVVIPNSLTTEVLTRKSIGMPLGRKTYEELQELDEKNNNRKGFLGAYFKFMRLLTGKKPLKDRLPKNQTQTENNINNLLINRTNQETNLIKLFLKQ